MSRKRLARRQLCKAQCCFCILLGVDGCYWVLALPPGPVTRRRCKRFINSKITYSVNACWRQWSTGDWLAPTHFLGRTHYARVWGHLRFRPASSGQGLSVLREAG